MILLIDCKNTKSYTTIQLFARFFVFKGYVFVKATNRSG